MKKKTYKFVKLSYPLTAYISMRDDVDRCHFCLCNEPGGERTMCFVPEDIFDEPLTDDMMNTLDFEEYGGMTFLARDTEHGRVAETMLKERLEEFPCDYFDDRIAAYVDRTILLTYGNKALADYVKSVNSAP